MVHDDHGDDRQRHREEHAGHTPEQPPERQRGEDDQGAQADGVADDERLDERRRSDVADKQTAATATGSQRSPKSRKAKPTGKL